MTPRGERACGACTPPTSLSRARKSHSIQPHQRHQPHEQPPPPVRPPRHSCDFAAGSLPALPPSSPPPSPRCPAISARLAMAEAPSPPPRVGGRPGAALAPRLPSTSQHGGPPCLPAPHAPRNRARPMQRAAPHTPSAPRPLATARGVAAGSAAAGGLLRGAGADPPAAGETLRARGGPGVRRGGGGQAALALAARPGDPPPASHGPACGAGSVSGPQLAAAASASRDLLVRDERYGTREAIVIPARVSRSRGAPPPSRSLPVSAAARGGGSSSAAASAACRGPHAPAPAASPPSLPARPCPPNPSYPLALRPRSTEAPHRAGLPPVRPPGRVRAGCR